VYTSTLKTRGFKQTSETVSAQITKIIAQWVPGIYLFWCQN